MPMQFLDPRNDVAFKKIFGSEEHKRVTISFLNSILEFTGEQAITQIEFLNTEQHPFLKEKKENILDILCTDQTGKRYIVEMQVVNVKEFGKRMVYYGTKTYALQLGERKPYTELEPVIVVAIIDFIMFPHKQQYKSIHWLLDNKTYEHDLKELTFAFVELPKFTKNEHELVNAQDKWLYFIKNIKSQDHIPASLAQGEFKEACGIVERMTWPEAEFNNYIDAFVRATDLEGAIIAGREKREREIALNMLKKNIAIEIVREITGLSLEQIKALKRSP